MIPDTEVILRVVIGACLGAMVGYERERTGQPAGLRTHMILVIGSTLTMTLSINLALQFLPSGISGDPGRLAAQVISGIGFLGAGAILRYGITIKGLTTATSLWTMAVVGLAVGAGYYLTGIVTTLILLLILVILTIIERRFIDIYPTIVIQISAEDQPNLLPQIQAVLQVLVKSMETPSVEKNMHSKRLRIEYTAKVLPGYTAEAIIERLSTIEGIRSIKAS